MHGRERYLARRARELVAAPLASPASLSRVMAEKRKAASREDFAAASQLLRLQRALEERGGGVPGDHSQALVSPRRGVEILQCLSVRRLLASFCGAEAVRLPLVSRGPCTPSRANGQGAFDNVVSIPPGQTLLAANPLVEKIVEFAPKDAPLFLEELLDFVPGADPGELWSALASRRDLFRESSTGLVCVAPGPRCRHWRPVGTLTRRALTGG